MKTLQFSSAHISAQMTLSGRKCGLGALRFGDVFIPAFGPQSLPLSDSRLFGISLDLPFDAETIRDSNESVLKGWTRCYAERDAWLYFSSIVTPDRIRLSARVIGNEQLRLVFYVQAKQCTLGKDLVFSPGQLCGYEGIQEVISFDQKVRFRCKEKCMMQLIPLSGDDCFWNANFLLSFEFSRARSLFGVINLVLD